MDLKLREQEAQVTRRRDWDDMFGGFDTISKSVSRMHDLSTGLRGDRAIDTLLKSISGVSALSTGLRGDRAIDTLLKSISGVSALSTAGAGSHIFGTLFKSVSGITALRMANESARGFDSLFESASGTRALTKSLGSTLNLDSLFHGVRSMSALRMASESTRAFDTLFKSMAHALARPQELESVRGFDSLFKGVSQKNALPLAFEGARALDSLFKSAAGLSEFRAAAAVAGWVGNFDRDLTRAAVAAAALIEATASEPEVLEEVREQSALVDLMTDVEVLAQSPTGAEVREVMKQTGALLDALFAKHEEHQKAASSTMEKRAIEKVFKYALSLLVSLLITYYAKCGVLDGEQSSRLVKQDSEGSNQDAVALLSTVNTPELMQAEDLSTVREALECLTTSEESAQIDPAHVYIVRYRARLLVNPSMKSTKVADLHPRQQVLLLQRKHKWVQVQYYDYLLGTRVEGWVLKKYVVTAATTF
jgi:hypothetical protein